MIVKIQLPIADFGKNNPPLALVYNKDKSIMLHVPITQPLQTRMGGKLKGFFHVEHAKSGELEIGDAAPWQEW